MIIIEILLSLWVLFLLLAVAAKLFAAFILHLSDFLHWVHTPFRKLTSLLCGDNSTLTLNPRVMFGYPLSKLIAVCVYATVAYLLGASGTVIWWAAAIAFLCVG